MVYSVPEFAKKVGVHRSTVHRWVQKGLIPATVVGTGRGFFLIPGEALEALEARPKKKAHRARKQTKCG